LPLTPSLDIVRALLKKHSPADDSEAESLRRIHELIDTASAPFSREHYVPGHLTASAIVLNEPRDKVMLIFHGKLKRWLQPGGHFDEGENDPSVAAAREVLEETGLKSRWPEASPTLLDVDVHDIPERPNAPRHCHFDLRMLVMASGAFQAGDDAHDAKWVNAAEAKAMNLDPGIVRMLKKVWK
jgi:8-oxo-dGTP pyrophosphatase MutT (NUDIX family)